MIDESFHLTPLDVRRTDFPAALRGYDKARVDEFRDRVANELERLTRINQELEAKAKGFHEQLRAFRERDKALNEALVSAQQLRADTGAQAEREAQLVLREARAEGARLVDVAKAEVRRLAGEIEGLERSRRAYLAQLRAMVARQLSELEAIPEVSAGPLETRGQPAPASQSGGAAPSAKTRTAGSDGSEASDRAASPTSSDTPPPPPVSPPAVVPPAVDSPAASGANGADGLRTPAQTPAWLNTVPAE